MTPKDARQLADADGHFRRQTSTFRNVIEKGGKHPPEKGRYLLYAGYLCPFAHRALIVRALKGLEDIIDISMVFYHLGENGWPFRPDVPGCTADPLFNSRYLKEIYLRADPEYPLRFTVPVLWDKKLNTIVNNESSEIIRMFNEEFDDLIDPKYKGLTYYPQDLRAEIDGINEWVYDQINNGVYKAGFAESQEAYDTNVVRLFEGLDRVEQLLSGRTFLAGPGDGILTEADIRLYTTIIRFDVAYHGQFKCNLGMIRHDYPNLDHWLRRLYWNYPAFKQTTNFEHIKKGYYSNTKINPTQIVPKGPREDILGPV